MGPHSHLLLPPGPSSGCRPSDRGAPQLGIYIPRGPSPAQEISRLGYWLPHVEGPQGKLSPRGMGTIQGATRLQTAQGGQDGQPQLPLLIRIARPPIAQPLGPNWRDFHELSVHSTQCHTPWPGLRSCRRWATGSLELHSTYPALDVGPQSSLSLGR